MNRHDVLPETKPETTDIKPPTPNQQKSSLQNLKQNDAELQTEMKQSTQPNDPNHHSTAQIKHQQDLFSESSSTFDLMKFKKLERLLFAKVGDTLCRDMFTRHSERTSIQIADRIRCATSKQSKYVHTLSRLKNMIDDDNDDMKMDDTIYIF